LIHHRGTRLEALVPGPQRETFVWMYRNLAVDGAVDGAANGSAKPGSRGKQ
jgi:hypothetical protein